MIEATEMQNCGSFSHHGVKLVGHTYNNNDIWLRDLYIEIVTKRNYGN